MISKINTISFKQSLLNTIPMPQKAETSQTAKTMPVVIKPVPVQTKQTNPEKKLNKKNQIKMYNEKIIVHNNSIRLILVEIRVI